MPPRLVVNGSTTRQLRTNAKLTQQDAAVQLDLAISSLRRIERGRESVQLTTLGKLSQLYRVEPQTLLDWEG